MKLVVVDIFIDESGAFAEVPPGREKFCAVTAAVIRSSLVPVLAERLRELRLSWSVESEIKGSALNEQQMSQALRLFAAYDVTAVVSVIDTGQHPPELLREFRDGQADKIAAATTPQHPASLTAAFRVDAERWRRLSGPSTMQIYTTLSAAENVIRMMDLYFVLRDPSELGLFRWTFDAKTRESLTNAEELWKKYACPFLQDLFLQEPAAGLEGGDYSHYERSYRSEWTELPDHLKPHLKEGVAANPTRGRITDLKKLMLGDLVFDHSEANAGLQMADMIGSAVTRALNESLGVHGWERAGRLLIRRKEQPVIMMALGPRVEGRQRADGLVRSPAPAVLSRLNRWAKPMFPRDGAGTHTPST